MINRVIWIILDSVGMGELPDADKFGDSGANTIAHVINSEHIELPNLCKLGYGNIDGMNCLPKYTNPIGCFARLKEISNGKDTTIGHWEMVGIHTKEAFPTYPNGFPKEVIDEFVYETGCGGVLGNKVASGTTILDELGTKHMNTGYPIIYTSADSVFQIACHEQVVPLETLYDMCSKARKILTGKYNAARVIARPFIGEEGNWIRTANRHDYSVKPNENNLLFMLKKKGINVLGVGKIPDIFANVGITESIHTENNMDGMEKTIECMKNVKEGLIFTNLVEFDSKWGHRRDVKGYAQGLVEFDNQLSTLIQNMTDNDLLIINADHGCDPTFKGTDHTREYIPLIMYGKSIKSNINLHTGDTFANIGQTIGDIFKTGKLPIGESYLKKIC